MPSAQRTRRLPSRSAKRRCASRRADTKPDPSSTPSDSTERQQERPGEGSRRLSSLTAKTHSYAGAGVSLDAADAVVERLRTAVESTGATGFGAFAGLLAIDERRLLAASTDGVGTKLTLARARGALRACGEDLAAHCINDVITTGA